ncbi:hypothetical protein MNB_SV-4-915 [hydrothermal vent metagenome]|uniref:Bacterial surface antigen (D15) domain-containing protein n=1 Tax=hydrothermal vent metagenome TaxID=652676 RepID=A0A1W1E9I9_9ZZZZ
MFQPQTISVATLFYGSKQDIITNGTPDTANFSGGFLGLFDYKIPGTNRVLLSISGLKSYFPKARYYLYNHTNDSKEEQYIESSGDNDFIYATLKYVLSLGDGLDNPEGLYTLKHGFAVGRENYGGGIPFVTGRTALGVTGFYEHYTFDNNLAGAPRSTNGLKEWNTNGVRFFVEHDNTDYDLNPSRGYQFRLQYSKDFGWRDAKQSWDFLEFKYNHYINLPTFTFTQQNVLAMSFWTGYSFSWDRNGQIDNNIDAHRPPPWEGARLGGIFRMRGYNTNRFSDKAVVYGTAEYRAVLKWNPFRKSDYIPVAIDWLQVVGFVEAGRVHESYNFDLLSDMKYDAGISLRAMAAQVPVRLDIAASDEGVNFWVMVFHPFDF